MLTASLKVEAQPADVDTNAEVEMQQNYQATGAPGSSKNKSVSEMSHALDINAAQLIQDCESGETRHNLTIQLRATK